MSTEVPDLKAIQAEVERNAENPFNRTSPPESGLGEITNDPIIVKAFGREYPIRKFTLGPLYRALPYIAPMGYALRAATKGDAVDAIVTALSVSGESMIGLISIATQEPIEFLEDKDPLDGLDIVVAIVEKNVDCFFEPENVKRLSAAFDRLTSVIQKHGGATLASS